MYMWCVVFSPYTKSNGNNAICSKKKIVTKNKPKFSKINYILHMTLLKKADVDLKRCTGLHWLGAVLHFSLGETLAWFNIALARKVLSPLPAFLSIL